MYIRLLALLLLLAPAAFAAPDSYVFDKDHTHILFFINHEGFSNTVGRIKAFSGSFTFDDKEPTASSIDVTLDPASVDTSVPMLDKTLQGGKFFNTATYPTMHFKSTHITITGAHSGDVTGDFTMLGITKPLVLHVTYNKSGITPFTNNYTSGFSADATLKRAEYGMNAYSDAIGDDVHIHIETEGSDPSKHPGNSKAPH